MNTMSYKASAFFMLLLYSANTFFRFSTTENTHHTANIIQNTIDRFIVSWSGDTPAALMLLATALCVPFIAMVFGGIFGESQSA